MSTGNYTYALSLSAPPYTSSFNSPTINVKTVDAIYVHTNLSGTFNATVKLQVCGDKPTNVSGEAWSGLTNWIDLAGFTSTVSNTSNVDFNVSNIYAPFLRVAIVLNSGTITSGSVVCTTKKAIGA